MKINNKKEEILNFIKKNPHLTFRQIRFYMELNESTLNKALINLLKLDLIKKSIDKKYFIKGDKNRTASKTRKI